MTRRRLLLLIIGMCPILVAVALRREPTLAQDQPARGAAKQGRELQGAPSCSASVCHGGSAIGQPLGEATTWRSLDPHARAYDTLLSRQAQTIARILWDDKTQAHDAPLCLKCHVDPGYEHARPNFRKQDGVGCESCHGAASDWLAPHYRPAWQTISKADKDAKGFADTKSLPGRAAICARCHVGTPNTNVDHDLIAAGHPALRFEFATYFANLPPHWDVTKDKKTNSAATALDFEARAWAFGQIVTAAHALDLLAHRVEKSWPEFAEMDCFSCHHDLQGERWRQSEKHLQARRPGALVPSDWHTSMLPDALAVLKSDAAKMPSLQKFREAPTRDPKPATKLAASLRMLAASKVQPANDGVSMPPRLLRRTDRNWDEATQRYFALMALRQMNQDTRQPPNAELERAIQSLRAAVTFPPGLGSPRGFVPFSRK